MDQTQRPPTYRIGSLFAGIGGIELGIEWSGIGKTVYACEQDEYCQKILQQNFPNIQVFNDVTQLGSNKPNKPPPIEILCGGFPCQDISSQGHAGRAARGRSEGLDGQRSGLWSEFARLINEQAPKWVVIENVASGAHHWVDQVSSDLAKLKYESLPLPVSAEDLGAPHQRKRIFILGRQISNSRCRTFRNQSEITNIFRTLESEPNMPSVEPANGSRHGIRSSQSRTSHPQPGWQPDTSNRTKFYFASKSGITRPCFLGVADGVSPELVEEAKQRGKAHGNAVVPQCAQVVGHCIALIDSLTK